VCNHRLRSYVTYYLLLLRIDQNNNWRRDKGMRARESESCRRPGGAAKSRAYGWATRTRSGRQVSVRLMVFTNTRSSRRHRRRRRRLAAAVAAATTTGVVAAPVAAAAAIFSSPPPPSCRSAFARPWAGNLRGRQPWQQRQWQRHAGKERAVAIRHLQPDKATCNANA